MNRTSENSEAYTICPKFEKTFMILGKKWSGLVIEVLLKSGPLRFVDIAKKIPDVSDRLLTERLKELESEGLVTRCPAENEKLRMNYMLTDKGAGLKNVMEEIQKWGDRWLTAEDVDCHEVRSQLEGQHLQKK